MRTPNTSCILCGKPLYRRPYEMAQTRYAACMAHRAMAQSVVGVTERQREGLAKGSVKGTNHRRGYKHRDESKRKTVEANRKFWANNPDARAARGEKMRAEKHYRWNGGSSKLNNSIRLMTENRKWMDAVKARDGYCCVRCGTSDGKMESHHIKSLAELIAELGIKSRDDARAHSDKIWNLDNGETLCERCHYAAHGRRLAA